MKDNKTKTTTLRLSPDMLKELEEMKEQTNLSRTAIITIAIRDLLDNKSKREELAKFGKMLK